MAGVLLVLAEALHTTFALFARKLILSAEVIAVVAVLGWRLDARFGVPLWPRRRHVSDVIAAGATLAVVLFVAFVRDFAELGARPDFVRYSVECLGVITALTALAGMLRAPRWGELLALLVSVCAGVAMLEGVTRVAPLDALGAVFVGPGARAHHGLAAALFVAVAAASVARLVLKTGAVAWDVFLVFALTALVQGFLAFRGVSALFILTAAGAVAWRMGWRITVRRKGRRLLVVFVQVVEAARATNSDDPALKSSALRGA